MSDTIKVDESIKEQLKELKEGDTISKYGTLSYNDCIRYLLDVHDGDAERVTVSTDDTTESTDDEEDDTAGVRKSDAGSNVEDKIEAVRVDGESEEMELEIGDEGADE